MIKKLFNICCLLLFLLIPLSHSFRGVFLKFIPYSKIPFNNLKQTFLTVSKDKIFFLHKGVEEKNIETFIDFSHNGYYTTYDKMGEKIQLFKLNEKKFEWQNTHNYPRISFPYLFLFSSDLSKINIFDLRQRSGNKIFDFKSEDQISSWKCEKSGKFCILGALDGHFYILKRQKKSKKDFLLKKYILKKSRINYVKGVSIDSKGNFFVQGSLYPEILAYGNYKHDKINYTKTPSTGRRQRKIIQKSSFVFIQTESGVLIYDKENDNITSTFSLMPFLSVESINFNGVQSFFVLYKKGGKNRLDVLIGSKKMYSVYFDSNLLPILHKSKNKLWILWEKGALTL